MTSSKQPKTAPTDPLTDRDREILYAAQHRGADLATHFEYGDLVERGLLRAPGVLTHEGIDAVRADRRQRGVVTWQSLMSHEQYGKNSIGAVSTDGRTCYQLDRTTGDVLRIATESIPAERRAWFGIEEA